MKKIILSAIAIVSISIAANAQSSITATASATIVTPISIVKDVDMNFGNIAVQTTTGGDVILATDGSRTKTAGVTLPVAAPGTVTAAQFTVKGNTAYTYAISLPAAAVVLTTTGGATMSATAFTCSLASKTGTLTTGTESFTVGATLTVAPGQVAGTYTTASPFTVTVNYN